MKLKLMIAALCAMILTAGASAGAQEPVKAYGPMAPFAKLAGKAWRGTGTGPDGKEVTDIAIYEMILGGRALQATHRLEDGSYGGRTIFFFDEGAQKYVFHYFTTAGFHTIGTVQLTDNGFRAIETVQNHPQVAEVRSRIIVESDSLRVVSSTVNHEGVRSEGDELVYKEIPMPDPLY